MKGARFPYLLLGGVLLLLTFVPVSTAIAAEPLKFTEQFEFTDVVNCSGFLAIDELVLVQRVTIFFDNEGNSVSAQVHQKFRGIVTNSVTGKSVVDRADFTFFVDFAEEGTFTVVGKVFGLTAPGEGSVFLDAGRIVFDADDNIIFLAGPKQFLFEGLTGICAAVD